MAERVFEDIPQFLIFLATLPMRERLADTTARAVVAEQIKDAVKSRIGNASKLPPPLAQSTQDERVRLGFSADDTLLRTGELYDSFEWEHVSPRITGVGTDSPYAPYHEFGGSTEGRPPKRAPMAHTMAEGDEEFFVTYSEAFSLLFGRGI